VTVLVAVAVVSLSGSPIVSSSPAFDECDLKFLSLPFSKLNDPVERRVTGRTRFG